MNARALVGGAMLAASLLGGCAFETAPAGRTSESTRPAPTQKAPSASQASVDPAQVERLKRVMIPLIQVMNKPKSPSQVKVGIIDDPSINAANAGNGEFYVTTGLLQKASDEQLLAVMAHEVAHDDLGHVAKAQRLQTGLAVGMVILDQIIPGSGQLTPVAGTLIARAYGRQEEYQADAHGSEILKRAGYPPKVMEETLTWLMNTEGGSEGGFFSTHPATDDRITALRKNGAQ